MMNGARGLPCRFNVIDGDASMRLTATSRSVGISAPDRSTPYSQQWYKGERGHAEGDQIN